MHLLQHSSHFVNSNMEVIWSKDVKDPCYGLLHFLIVFKTISPDHLLQLGERTKTSGSKFWTVGRVRDSFDDHHCQHKTLLRSELLICLHVLTVFPIIYISLSYCQSLLHLCIFKTYASEVLLHHGEQPKEECLDCRENAADFLCLSIQKEQ